MWQIMMIFLLSCCVVKAEYSLVVQSLCKVPQVVDCAGVTRSRGSGQSVVSPDPR
jgi:hypothetical protein